MLDNEMHGANMKISQHVLSCYVMLCCVMLCYISNILEVFRNISRQY